MKILVAVKQVAALDEDFEIRADGRDVDADFLIRDLNEWDDFSLEEAVKIKEAVRRAGGSGRRCRWGPKRSDESLRKCLAKGADRAIRIWDAAIEGSDSIAIARVLAGGGQARGARHAVRRRAILRSVLCIHRHCHRGLARLAARRRGELPRLRAGREERRIPPRARGRTAA